MVSTAWRRPCVRVSIASTPKGSEGTSVKTDTVEIAHDATGRHGYRYAAQGHLVPFTRWVRDDRGDTEIAPIQPWGAPGGFLNITRSCGFTEAPASGHVKLGRLFSSQISVYLCHSV